jgi:hypothetical protein
VGLLPCGIGAECFEGGIARGLILVLDEVDQLSLGVLPLRNEVADVLDSVLLEQLQGVIAKAGMKGIQFAFGGIINAHFVKSGLGGRFRCEHGQRGGGCAKCGKDSELDHRWSLSRKCNRIASTGSTFLEED